MSTTDIISLRRSIKSSLISISESRSDYLNDDSAWTPDLNPLPVLDELIDLVSGISSVAEVDSCHSLIEKLEKDWSMSLEVRAYEPGPGLTWGDVINGVKADLDTLSAMLTDEGNTLNSGHSSLLNTSSQVKNSALMSTHTEVKFLQIDAVINIIEQRISVIELPEDRIPWQSLAKQLELLKQLIQSDSSTELQQSIINHFEWIANQLSTVQRGVTWAVSMASSIMKMVSVFRHWPQ